MNIFANNQFWGVVGIVVGSIMLALALWQLRKD